MRDLYGLDSNSIVNRVFDLTDSTPLLTQDSYSVPLYNARSTRGLTFRDNDNVDLTIEQIEGLADAFNELGTASDDRRWPGD